MPLQSFQECSGQPGSRYREPQVGDSGPTETGSERGAQGEGGDDMDSSTWQGEATWWGTQERPHPKMTKAGHSSQLTPRVRSDGCCTRKAKSLRVPRRRDWGEAGSPHPIPTKGQSGDLVCEMAHGSQARRSLNKVPSVSSVVRSSARRPRRPEVLHTLSVFGGSYQE